MNIQNTETYFFFWRSLTHKYEIDNHRERVSHYAKHFQELSHRDVRFSMKIKNIPAFEQRKNLKTNIFDLSSFSNAESVSNAGPADAAGTAIARYSNNFSPKCFEIFFEERIDSLFYENQF